MRNPKSRFLAKSAVFAAAIALTTCSLDPVATAQAKPSALASVLAQMNAASAKFTSAQADLRQELFDKALSDTETQTGQIYFERKAGVTQMGMKMLPPDATAGTPPSQIMEFKDSKLRMLTTGTAQIDEFTASGKNQTLAETLITLGFGGSGTDLSKAWIIDDQGAESIMDGKQRVQTEKLDLVSKDANIKNTFSHITIWVDPVRDVSLKQTLFEASGGKATGDTKTVFFTNIRLNQSVDIGPFALKCKGKCTVVSH